MPTLWNWYLVREEDGMVAYGVVDGHPKLSDGLFIHTSPLEKAEVKGETLVLHTATGHGYPLQAENMDGSHSEETAECLSSLGVDGGFVGRCLSLCAEREEREREKLQRELAPGELLLEVVGVTTLRAWLKADGGSLVRPEPTIHVGTFQDSVLITDWAERTVDFRYFPKGDRMEPYHVSDGLKTIKIRNLGGSELTFGRIGRTVRCPAGETTAVPTADHDREGLFSPDAVNGKGLYRRLLLEEPKKDGETE